MTVRAFTLLEVIVATAIIGIIAAGLFSFIADLNNRRVDLDEALEQTRVAQGLFERIETAARTSVATTPAGDAGFRGSAESLAITYRVLDGDGVIHRTLDISTGGGTLTLSDGDSSSVTGTIHRVGFEFHDGNDWSESVGSGATTLPVAVRVKLWFDPPPADDDFGFEDEAETDRPDGFADSPPSESDDEPAPDRVRVIDIPGPTP